MCCAGWMRIASVAMRCQVLWLALLDSFLVEMFMNRLVSHILFWVAVGVFPVTLFSVAEAETSGLPDFVPLAEKHTPAVVKIETETKARARTPQRGYGP